MTEEQAPAFGIEDAFLKECSISRDRELSGEVTQTLSLEVTLVDPPSQMILVQMKVAVAAAGITVGKANPAIIQASATYAFVIDKAADTLPREWALPLLQIAWPYMRSALDAGAGLARVPAFTLAPNAPSFTMETPASEESGDGTE